MAALPPSYESNSTGSTILLNITPSPSSVDFQTGFLGVSRSSVAGEVQVKQSGDDTTSYGAVELSFRGVERLEGPAATEVELFFAKRTLWSADEPSTSEAASSGIPTNLPFDIELTPDLPHCVHTAHSSLQYSLVARLLPTADASAPIVTSTVPVHLTRYLPGTDRYRDHTEPENTPSRCTDAPTTFSLAHPAVVHISLGRTIYRRSEPIELRIRLPPPSRDLVQEKGVTLRSVAAELVRVVTCEPPPNDHEVDNDDEEVHVRTVLSHSGKSCRFSKTRDLFLRLWLTPSSVSEGVTTCEGITQSTILHRIEFYISISLTLAGREGDRESIVLERRVLILPDQPPAPTSIRSEKQREAEVESTTTIADDEVLLRPPAPQYESNLAADLQASTSTPTRATIETTPTWWDGEDEIEYDGYEEASAGVVLRPPPPTIDEDSAPPSLEESDGVSSHGTDLNRPLTPADDDENPPLPPPPIDLAPPPDYHGGSMLPGIGQGPPAYSASRRADEVEVVPTLGRRRTEHGVV